MNRILTEVGFGSNYILSTSNILVNRINSSSVWTAGAGLIYYNIGSNVGIGTNNPQQKLDIQGTNPTIRLLDTNTDGNAIIMFRELNDLYGMDIAYIGNLDNKMYIRAFNNSATAVNHIAINRTDGYVGIGTASPATPLHIYNATSATLRLQTTTTTDASIELIRGTTADASTDWIMTNRASTGALIISSSASSIPADRFAISNGGFVGIGTATPAYNLDIYGTSPVNIQMFSPSQGSSWIRYREAIDLGFDVGYNGSGNRYAIYAYDNVATGVEYFSIGRGVGRITMGMPVGGTVATLSRLKVYGYLTETLLAEFVLASGASGIGIYNNTINAIGTDVNVNMSLASKGTGTLQLWTNSVSRLSISSAGAVSIGGTLSAGATTITGNVGIGTAPHATYKLDVLGDINCSGAFRVGGVAQTSWSVGTPSTNIYYNLGNVGIGATTTSDVDDNTSFAIPTATLFVKGGASASGTCDVVIRGGAAGSNNGKARLWLSADASHSSYIQSEHTGSGNTQLTFGTANGNALPTERMKINESGELIVSGNKIAIKGTYPTLYLRHSTNRTAMLHCNGDLLYILSGAVGGADTVDNWSITANGRWPLEINLNNNNAKFGGDVNATSFNSTGSIYATTTIQASGAYYFANNTWHNTNEGNARFHFSSSSTTYIRGATTGGSRNITFRNGGDTDIGYFDANNNFWAYSHLTISDRRIKRDIVDINDETALNMLLLVQPTTYYYRDEARNKGGGKVYGFIAQQIKEVIPDAVYNTFEIIANIYKTCLVYNKREIYHIIPQDVAIDTEISIFDKEGGQGKRYKIKEIHEDHFVIDEDIEGDDCFVFGYSIDDLHGLDKSYIYTLNVCATQELHRRMEAQNVIIKSQDERIKSQDERIRYLETKMTQILNNMSL